jgi:hypothetical protein
LEADFEEDVDAEAVAEDEDLFFFERKDDDVDNDFFSVAFVESAESSSAI